MAKTVNAADFFDSKFKQEEFAIKVQTEIVCSFVTTAQLLLAYLPETPKKLELLQQVYDLKLKAVALLSLQEVARKQQLDASE